MNITRTLLRPAARLAGLHANVQLRRFLTACMHGRQTQRELLRRLIERHADTRFGRDHGLAAVRDYDDFRRAVPVGDYDSLADYHRAVYHGDPGALFPPDSPPLMFALTSGTAGEPKRIPVTAESLAHYRRGWNAFGIKLYNDHPAAWLRKILQITSSPIESTSPAGIPCGAISGLLAGTQKRIVRRMYPVSPRVMAIEDPAAKYYTILRLSAPEDVALISTANPSSVIKLLTTGEQHAERLLRDLHDGTLTPPGNLPEGLADRLHLRKHPALAGKLEADLARDGHLSCRHFWNLTALMHWTGGTLGLYLPEVRRRTGGVPIRDIGLLASEGRFSIPLHSEDPAGLAEVTASFMEFIPAGEIDSADPTVLPSHQLDVGEEYFLVLTNYAGLWRYSINDRIRVTGYFGQTPIFAFLSKGAHTANLTGEKLTEHQVVQAVQDGCRQLALPVQRFLAQGHFTSPPHYRLTVEANGQELGSLAELVDRRLQSLNLEYAGKRHSARLGPVRVVAADGDELLRREEDILTRRGGRREQYKHQYLLTDVVTDVDPA